MPAPSPFYAVNDCEVQLGDPVLELRYGMGAPQEAPIVQLQRRLRQLEIRVIALETAQPAARWGRLRWRWATRVRKLNRWLEAYYSQVVLWIEQQVARWR